MLCVLINRISRHSDSYIGSFFSSGSHSSMGNRAGFFLKSPFGEERWMMSSDEICWGGIALKTCKCREGGEI